MAVLLVRHAEAGDRDRWEGPDHLRPLSGEGEAQASGLVDLLDGVAVARVMSSPYLRCTQTVEPLAAARGVVVEPCEDLAEGEAGAALALVRRLLDGRDEVVLRTHGDVVLRTHGDVVLRTHGDVVLCTHGDVMEAVLDGLGVDRPAETEKGATWALGPGAPRYLPPPS